MHCISTIIFQINVILQYSQFTHAADTSQHVLLFKENYSTVTNLWYMTPTNEMYTPCVWSTQ